jgi:GxxExxY protein
LPDTERLSSQIVDAPFKVPSALGPGLLESTYETCLLHEMKSRNLKAQSQLAPPIIYADLRID